MDDKAIVKDLSEVIQKIREIIQTSEYKRNANDQSVVEICITRVTSCVRETGSIEKHADALVSLLESCLAHCLAPSSKDEDPPHAKISSDVLSCIFLVSCSVPPTVFRLVLAILWKKFFLMF